MEYFPQENIIIKRHRSIKNPIDLREEDTKIYSDEENPLIKLKVLKLRNE
jgi:hypothetical protein